MVRRMSSGLQIVSYLMRSRLIQLFCKSYILFELILFFSVKFGPTFFLCSKKIIKRLLSFLFLLKPLLLIYYSTIYMH